MVDLDYCLAKWHVAYLSAAVEPPKIGGYAWRHVKLAVLVASYDSGALDFAVAHVQASSLHLLQEVVPFAVGSGRGS